MSRFHNLKLDIDIAHIEPLQMKRHIAFKMTSLCWKNHNVQNRTANEITIIHETPQSKGEIVLDYDAFICCNIRCGLDNILDW